LGCDIVKYGSSAQTFQGNLLLLSATLMLQKFDILIPNTVPHPWRQ